MHCKPIDQATFGLLFDSGPMKTSDRAKVGQKKKENQVSKKEGVPAGHTVGVTLFLLPSVRKRKELAAQLQYGFAAGPEHSGTGISGASRLPR